MRAPWFSSDVPCHAWPVTIDIIEHRDGDAVRRILEALPEWFGIPEAIDSYAADAVDGSYGSLMAIADGEPVGVLLTRRHFPESAEIHLMAVHPDVRGTGIGRRLVERVVDDLSADDCKLLSVHTVGPSFENAPYAQTRAFYTRMGFLPLEEHDDLEWPGPTLILVRALAMTDQGHAES